MSAKSMRHTKLIAFFVIIGILSTSSGIFYLNQMYSEKNIRDSLFEQQRERQIELLKAFAQNINSDLQLVEARLALVANSQTAPSLDLSSAEFKSLVFKTYGEINNVADVIAILDDKDVVRYYTFDADASFRGGGNDLAMKDYVTQTRLTMEPVISKGEFWADGLFRISITHPIVDSNGKYAGMIVASIPTVSFFERYGNVHEIDAQSLVALDEDGTILVSANPDRIGKNFFGDEIQTSIQSNPTINKLYRNVLSGSPDSAVFTANHGERLSVGRPVYVNGQAALFIFISKPTVEIYSQIDNLMFAERLQLFSLLAATSIAFILLVIVFMRRNIGLEYRIRRRTEELAAANKELEGRDKVMKEFINIAAHELRAPIQPILLTTDDLMELAHGDDKNIELTKQQLNVLHRNAIKLQRLASDVLTV